MTRKEFDRACEEVGVSRYSDVLWECCTDRAVVTRDDIPCFVWCALTFDLPGAVAEELAYCDGMNNAAP